MSVINFTKLQLEYALVSDFCDKPHLLVEEIITLELWCWFVARDFSICPFKLQKEFSFSFVRNTRRTVPFFMQYIRDGLRSPVESGDISFYYFWFSISNVTSNYIIARTCMHCKNVGYNFHMLLVCCGSVNLFIWFCCCWFHESVC